MKKLALLLLVILYLGACNNKSYVRARVYERKEVGDSLLMIKYRYSTNGKIFIDSATVTNKVIEGDTIRVVIDSRNPPKSKPRF